VKTTGTIAIRVLIVTIKTPLFSGQAGKEETGFQPEPWGILSCSVATAGGAQPERGR
jgi:hypothetical protein